MVWAVQSFTEATSMVERSRRKVSAVVSSKSGTRVSTKARVSAWADFSVAGSGSRRRRSAQRARPRVVRRPGWMPSCRAARLTATRCDFSRSPVESKAAG